MLSMGRQVSLCLASTTAALSPFFFVPQLRQILWSAVHHAAEEPTVNLTLADLAIEDFKNLGQHLLGVPFIDLDALFLQALCPN